MLGQMNSRASIGLSLTLALIPLLAPPAMAADDDSIKSPTATQSAVSLPKVATRKVDFVKDIRPIFAENCYGCHGPTKQEAAFRLDHKATALRGGELGPAIVPGKSAESLLIQFVAGVKPDSVMPKKGERLTAQEVGLLRAWIDQGASWPDNASVQI